MDFALFRALAQKEGTEVATEEQLEFLQENGYEGELNVTYQVAASLCEEIKAISENFLAKFGELPARRDQKQVLRRAGIHINYDWLTRKQADRYWEYHQRVKPSAEQLQTFKALAAELGLPVKVPDTRSATDEALERMQKLKS